MFRFPVQNDAAAVQSSCSHHPRIVGHRPLRPRPRAHPSRNQRQPQSPHRAPDPGNLHPSLGTRRRRRLPPLPLRRIHSRRTTKSPGPPRTYYLNPKLGITGELRGGYGNAKVGNHHHTPPSSAIPRSPNTPSWAAPPTASTQAEIRHQRLRPRRHAPRQLRRRLQRRPRRRPRLLGHHQPAPPSPSAPTSTSTSTPTSPSASPPPTSAPPSAA